MRRSLARAGRERVLVQCRGGDAHYSLEFENVGKNQLLRVKITRKVTTLFGPATGLVGVVVFPRIR